MSDLLVTAYGAKGDGVTDSTAAIQAAITAAQPGDTVVVPAGTFMINALFNGDNFASGGIFLKSNMNLRLAASGILKAIPNSSTHYVIVTVKGCTNVKITGPGSIIGDRSTHIVPSPDPGQFGFGISIWNSSSNITVSGGLAIRQCFGDGLEAIGVSNLVIDGVVFDSNYRQNAALIDVNGVKISNCTFSNAGQSGLDMEPSLAAYSILNVTVNNCNFVNCGTLFPIGAKKVHLGMGSSVGTFKAISISGCQFDDKQQPIWAHDGAGTTGIPAWAAALNVVFYQGLKADWYRFWGYPTSWSGP